MAKYTCTLKGNHNILLSQIERDILNGSVSASYEDGCDWTVGDTQIAMRVYERYSFAGGNRVSLSLTLAGGQDGTLRLCAVTSGGSQAMFWKINTFGEEAFLDCLRETVEAYKRGAAE